MAPTVNKQMLSAETLSFLENALDREFYVPRKPPLSIKPPLRVMITDAGDKIAFNLIYKICSGQVFGDDQEVILHLNNSKGSVYHRDIALELFECGFSCYKDFVVSSNPAVLYKDVDYVVLIATYEQALGWIPEKSFMYQTVKACEVARYIMSFSKPDCKIILSGPSTKALVWFLGAFTRFAAKIPPSNITSVTCLDQTISKAQLAAKLKTTTTNIKNVVIWNCTYPDTFNTTVRMVPPDDIGGTKKKDIPLSELIDDQEWLNDRFRTSVFKRVMLRDNLKFGKAIASATAHHLKVLYRGTDGYDEIQCMGTTCPPGKLYSLPEARGFSFPVTVKNGQVSIIRNIEVESCTYLNRLRVVFNIRDSYTFNSSVKIVSYLSDYEKCKEKLASFKERNPDFGLSKAWVNKYFITPSPAETYFDKETANVRKSIVWAPIAQVTEKTRTKSSKKSSISFEK